MVKKLIGAKKEKEVKKIDWKSRLEALIPSYKLNKTNESKYKKLASSENDEIKTIMKQEGIEEFCSGDTKVTCYKTEKFSFNDEKLLAKLKKLKLTDCIKTKEYVDMDELERHIYDDEKLAKKLTDCQEHSETWGLRLGKAK